ASALPRGANTRAQKVNPYADGSLLGKYQRSANAHSTRFSSGPKIRNAISTSTTARRIAGAMRAPSAPNGAPLAVATPGALIGLPCALRASGLIRPRGGPSGSLDYPARCALRG